MTEIKTTEQLASAILENKQLFISKYHFGTTYSEPKPCTAERATRKFGIVVVEHEDFFDEYETFKPYRVFAA